MLVVEIAMSVAACIVDGRSGIFHSWKTVVKNKRFVGLQQKGFIRRSHICSIHRFHTLVQVTDAFHCLRGHLAVFSQNSHNGTDHCLGGRIVVFSKNSHNGTCT